MYYLRREVPPVVVILNGAVVNDFPKELLDIVSVIDRWTGHIVIDKDILREDSSMLLFYPPDVVFCKRQIYRPSSQDVSLFIESYFHSVVSIAINLSDGDNPSFLPSAPHLDFHLVIDIESVGKSSSCELLLDFTLSNIVLDLFHLLELIEFDVKQQFLHPLVDLVEEVVVRLPTKRALVPHFGLVQLLNAEQAERMSAAETCGFHHQFKADRAV